MTTLLSQIPDIGAGLERALHLLISDCLVWIRRTAQRRIDTHNGSRLAAPHLAPREPQRTAPATSAEAEFSVRPDSVYGL
jgi:hypothetical protein